MGSVNVVCGFSVNVGVVVFGVYLLIMVVLLDVGGGYFVIVKYVYVSFNWGLDLWGGKKVVWEVVVGVFKVVDIEMCVVCI